MRHTCTFSTRLVCDICGLSGYHILVGIEVVLVPSWVQRAMSTLLPNWLAITLGKTIFAARHMSERELEHELVHVAQWDVHGWTFPFRYLWASATAVRSGGHWYRDNAFEIEARS